MKTKEQKAKEYAITELTTKRTIDVPGMGGLIGMIERAYLAGCKEADKWIPIKELPIEGCDHQEILVRGTGQRDLSYCALFIPSMNRWSLNYPIVDTEEVFVDELDWITEFRYIN